MAANDKPYQRLPGTGYRQVIPSWAILLLFFVIGIFALLFRGRRVQLWQGAEHLLLVEWDGSREYYKRFDYGDIQAVMVQKTGEGRLINAVLGVVTGIFLGLAIPASDIALRISLLVLAGLFGLILLANALAGATCKCWIRTAVQLDDLPSLSRLPRTRKVLERIRPLIVAAQGQLAPNEVPARMQEWIATQAATPAAASPGNARFVADDPNAPPRILP